ncbi:MAG: hypothetical protein M1834_004245 [Cirrosporium novae-zelandiae]|nr:MAG: hypothetical protein M1834_004245 [Cirrosporium novae-zelandiae]
MSTVEYQDKRRYPPRPQRGNPVEVTSLDHLIATHGGTTSTLQMSPRALQKAKDTPTGTPNSRLEELVREVGSLRQEIVYHQEVRAALLQLHEKTTRAFEILQYALQDMSEKVAASEKRFSEYWGIDLDAETAEIPIMI